MTTLTEQLREFSAFENCDSHEIAVLKQAADEIDRLAAETAALREERDALVIKCNVADARLKLGVQKANEERDRIQATLDLRTESFDLLMKAHATMREERDALAAKLQHLRTFVSPAGESAPSILHRLKAIIDDADDTDFDAILAARDAQTRANALLDAADRWGCQMIHETAREELRRMAGAIKKESKCSGGHESCDCRLYCKKEANHGNG